MSLEPIIQSDVNQAFVRALGAELGFIGILTRSLLAAPMADSWLTKINECNIAIALGACFSHWDATRYASR